MVCVIEFWATAAPEIHEIAHGNPLEVGLKPAPDLITKHSLNSWIILHGECKH